MTKLSDLGPPIPHRRHGKDHADERNHFHKCPVCGQGLTGAISGKRSGTISQPTSRCKSIPERADPRPPLGLSAFCPLFWTTGRASLATDRVIGDQLGRTANLASVDAALHSRNDASGGLLDACCFAVDRGPFKSLKNLGIPSNRRGAGLFRQLLAGASVPTIICDFRSFTSRLKVACRL